MELSQRIFWVATGLWLLLSFWLFFHGADVGFWLIVSLVLILYTLSGFTYSRARKKEQELAKIQLNITPQAKAEPVKSQEPIKEEVKTESIKSQEAPK